MSLSGLHSPHASMSSDFSSALGLADILREHERQEEERQANEETTLINGSSVSKENSAEEAINSTLFRTILVVTIGSSFQFGYGTGVMNNSEEFIVQYFVDRGLEYSLVAWSTTVSCFGIGGLIGAILGPKVIGLYVGRRTTLLINNVFLIISSCLIAFARVWWFQAIGRVFVGIVAGVSTAVVPTFFSEISPIGIRGAVGTMHQLGITIGILVAQALSTPSLNLLAGEDRWQWLFLVPVMCGLLEVCVLPFCPESPAYLYKTKGRVAARRALVRLQSEQVADRYLGYIREEMESTEGADEDTSDGITVLDLFRDRNLRKQLIVGVVVQLMMQFSGIDAVFYYSTKVFHQANVSDPELATTCLGIVNVLVTVIAVKMMDTTGRKTLLKNAWIGMVGSYLLLTTSFVLKPYVGFMDQLSVIAMTGVIIFFAFGPGCIAWFIIAEIFPLHARDTAMAIGIAVNWIANWLVAFTFPILLVFTQQFTFLIFVATTAFFLYFTIRFVPETKGLTIKQVAEEFEHLTLCFCTGDKNAVEALSINV